MCLETLSTAVTRRFACRHELHQECADRCTRCPLCRAGLKYLLKKPVHDAKEEMWSNYLVQALIIVYLVAVVVSAVRCALAFVMYWRYGEREMLLYQ